MVEFVLIVALFVVAYRLRRASRESGPRVPVEIHVYHHFPDGSPGERQPDVLDEGDIPAVSNVVPLRRR